MELQVGDVFNLKKGMKVYAEVPKKFVYSNCKMSDKLTRTEITIGEKYSIAKKFKFMYDIGSEIIPLN